MAFKIISLVKTEAFQYFSTLKSVSERKLSIQLHFTNCGEGKERRGRRPGQVPSLVKVCFLNINVLFQSLPVPLWS